MRNLFAIFIVAFCLVWMPLQTQAAARDKAASTSKSVQASKAGKVFRDCPSCPQMVVLPAGKFDMGSPVSETDRDDDEGPVHPVKIDAFAMSKTEISRAQFAEFVKETRYDTGDRCMTLDAGKFAERDGNWRKPGYAQSDAHPVTCINWDDANAYAKWLSRKTRKQYRLPTEAEWEYAARANTRGSRYWGDKPELACKYANVTDKIAKEKIPASIAWRSHDCKDRYAYTAPVGRYRANAFGLKDMLGNVWEWTGDVYHDSYAGAPTNGGVWQGKGSYHVLRGGSWNSDPQNARAAVRSSNKATQRFSLFGLRLVRKLP